MAYKIEYSPESAQRYPLLKVQDKRKPGGWVIAGIFLAVLLWIRIYGVPDFMIPGDADVTKEAASVFVREIRDGVAVNDAITAFCRSILDGAGV